MVGDTQIEREQEELRLRMEESRDALAQKFEQLEEKMTETVETAAASVAEATASVLETVKSARASVTETVDSVTNVVQGTVDSVRTSVEETVDSMKLAFDINRQVDSHPWLMFAGAVAAGYFGTEFLIAASTDRDPRQRSNESSDRSPEAIRSFGEKPFASSQESSPNGYHSNGVASNGMTGGNHLLQTTTPTWMARLNEALGPAIVRLQGLAVGTALGAVRDVIVDVVPPAVKQPLAEVIDEVAEKLGGTRVHGRSASLIAGDGPPAHQPAA